MVKKKVIKKKKLLRVISFLLCYSCDMVCYLRGIYSKLLDLRLTKFKLILKFSLI